jgi:hypothetical protein
MTDNLSRRITETIRHSKGMTVAMLCQSLRFAGRSAVMSATCHNLAKRGFLVKQHRRMPGTTRELAWFLPSAALLRGELRHVSGPARRTEPIRALIEAQGAQTLDAIVAHTGIPRKAAHGALMAMIAGGEIERTGPANQQRFGLVQDDDEPWAPPTNYMTASRAWALGLRRAS